MRPQSPSDPAAGTRAQPEGFPRVYAVAKWLVIGSLAVLTVAAIVVWTLILGGFAASGFRATDPQRGAGTPVTITPDCAWPYGVTDRNAEAMCRMFARLTPEQREEVLRRRR